MSYFTGHKYELRIGRTCQYIQNGREPIGSAIEWPELISRPGMIQRIPEPEFFIGQMMLLSAKAL